MIRNLAIFCALAALPLAGACSSHSRPSVAEREVLIAVSYTKGDVGGFGFEVNGVGVVHFWGLDGGPSDLQLTREELSTVAEFVESQAAKAAVVVLSKLGHKLGRSDLPEVGFELGDALYGYPVCHRSDAPLDTIVKVLVEWANDFGRTHLTALWKEDFPVFTCLPGEHF